MNKADVDYILDTFHVIAQRDREKFGEYRTKRVILEIFDAMVEAERAWCPYRNAP